MKIFRGLIVSAAVLAMAAIPAAAKVTMPAIFADNMVVQQQTEMRIWGKAEPNKKVTVAPSWSKQKYTTTAGADGSWKTAVQTPAAGGPYEITISDGEALTIRNVLAGELWLCSGQSNMEMPMKGFKNQPVEGAAEALMESRNPNLRMFTVKRVSSVEVKDDVVGSWKESSPAALRDFSATAYFFGRSIQRMLDVPVGLVVVSWGGSSCEAWMNEDMLRAFPEAVIPRTQEDVKQVNRAPTVLFKGMLSPLIGLAMRGVIWYQGEDNVPRHKTYADMFSTMIEGWRKLWGIGEFPFYYCQIAPYEYALIAAEGEPVHNSAYLREAQSKVEQRVANTGMAVLMDAGFREGIHPPQKRQAGERLAMLALGDTYGVEGISGRTPQYKDIEIQGDTVVVSFERSTMWPAGRMSFESKQFKVAGEDRVFHPARAWISRSKIYVRSDKVAKPVAVRYAFENYADGDLFNEEGLPFPSFRSDDWPDECLPKK